MVMKELSKLIDKNLVFVFDHAVRQFYRQKLLRSL